MSNDYSTKDYVSIIQENRHLLVQDLMKDFVDGLKKSNVISDDDYDRIVGTEYVPVKDYHKMAHKLIDIIITKAPSDIEMFVANLEAEYIWLYELFPKKNKFTEEILVRGGVPKVPNRHVIRTNMLNKVKKALFGLKRGQFLVLHGMPGCGKTTLAAEALCDPNLMSSFSNCVMWLNGPGPDCDISSLHKEVALLLPEPVDLSANVRLDLVKFRNLLVSRDYLLVLDDVQSDKIIEFMNFGCKVLVTTKNQNVMGLQSSKDTTFIEVDSSFDLEETKKLFAQAVGVSTSELPLDCIIDINQKVSGFPLSVSLLAGYLEDNKEKARMKSSDIWMLLKSKLNNKDHGVAFRLSHGELNEPVNNVIGISIESLNERMKTLFYDFALFVEDVNIKREVFCTLWNLDVFEVEQILLQFVKISLLFRKWNGKYYVYGIHDSILSYLRGKTDKRELHQKLINRYREKCPNGNFALLPKNDNYIFYFIGYHLKNAGEYDLFANLYLNLEFIEAKLQTVGPAVFLSDYNKYRKEITNDGQEALLDIVREIELFIERSGQSIYQNAKNEGMAKADVVQFILQECFPYSYLYKKAIQLAAQRLNHTYIRFHLGPGAKDNYPSATLPQKVGIRCIKYSGCPNIAIIGYNDGSICMYNIKLGSPLYYYAVQRPEPVLGLDVNKDRTYFLSFSSKKVYIWPLYTGDFKTSSPESSVFEFSEEKPNTPPPPPSRFQEGHSPLLSGVPGIPCSATLSHPMTVTCAVYAALSPVTIAVTTRMSISVWKNGDVMWTEKTTETEFWSCVFCKEDSMVLVGSDTNISAYSAETGALLIRDLCCLASKAQSPILQILVNPDNRNDIFFLTEDVVGKLSSETTGTEPKAIQSKKDQTYLSFDIFKHIAISYADSDIEIIDKNSTNPLAVFHRPNSHVKCLALDNENLLVGYEDQTLCVWPLAQATSVTSSPLPTPPCAVAWINDVPYSISPSNKNSLLLKKERDLVKEIPNVTEVDRMVVSSDGQYVAFCHEGNKVSKLSLKEPNFLMTYAFQAAPTFVQIFNYNKTYLVLSAPSKGQLLVWTEDKMKFLCNPDSRVQRAYLVRDCVLCVYTNGAIEVFNIEDPRVWKQVVAPAPHQVVTSTLLSSLGLLAVAAQDLEAKTESLLLYDTNSFEVVKKVSLNYQNLPTVCFSPNGNFLAVSQIGEIRLFDLAGKRERHVKVALEAGCMAVSNAGSVCLRHKASLVVVPADSEHPAHTSMSASVPFLSASPHSNRFLTTDAAGVVHIISLYPRQEKSSVSEDLGVSPSPVPCVDTCEDTREDTCMDRCVERCVDTCVERCVDLCLII